MTINLESFFGSLISFEFNNGKVSLRLKKGWIYNDIDKKPILTITFQRLKKGDLNHKLSKLQEEFIDSINITQNSIRFEHEYTGKNVTIAGSNFEYTWSEYAVADYKQEIDKLNELHNKQNKELIALRHTTNETKKFIHKLIDSIERKSSGLDSKNSGRKYFAEQDSLMKKVLNKLNNI